MLERTPNTDPSEWFQFLRDTNQELNEISSKGILVTGIDGHLSYLTTMLKLQGVPFNLSLQGGSRKMPLIYIAFGNKCEIPKQDKLIGVFPFSDQKIRLPACVFDCEPGAEYPFMSKCIHNQITGIVTAFAWKYPASPLSNDFIECSPSSFPPFPLIERNSSTLQLPYGTEEFFRALVNCWKENNIQIDQSEQKYADIKIEATMEIASANASVINRLPMRLVGELGATLGGTEQEFPQIVKKELQIIFRGCD
jgi:hypothetical protein